MKAILLVALCLLSSVFADVYMHNPRGSNNRYGPGNNNNRLFDSQNNNEGGYNWGPAMTYYTGSLLQIEWTQQHGCGVGNNNVECEIVLQYMCGPWIRDGTRDAQAPEDIETRPIAEQLEYGYHETAAYYDDCQTRRRNAGVFQADQNADPNQSATQTRQNNNRNGFECPEERDYYPYWHPSPWRDIAVLTSGPRSKRETFYHANTQNKNPKGYCLLKGSPDPKTFFDPKNPATHNQLWGKAAPQNNPTACGAADNDWFIVDAWNIPYPEIVEHPIARDNHLGNADSAPMTARYLWTLPADGDMAWDDPNAEAKQATCAFRLRYNITTEDFKGWQHVDEGKPMIDSKFNGENSPVQNDPEFPYGRDAQGILRNLSLALNTAQTGRTFQDRSHTFYIKPAPAWVAGTKIWNLNVRGRRGNIVQTYPATEYDFTPNQLKVKVNELIHIQWTGSDINENNQAGEGTDRTDRNNIVQLSRNTNNDARKNYPEPIETQDMFDQQTAYLLAHLGQPEVCLTATQTACCRTYEQLKTANANNNNAIEQDVQNCGKLNSAPAYFNAGLIKMQKAGTYQYISTRNNNFSNRSQKATIYVNTLLPAPALAAVAVGGAGFVGASAVAGGVWYAKTHAASSVSNIFNGVKI